MFYLYKPWFQVILFMQFSSMYTCIWNYLLTYYLLNMYFFMYIYKITYICVHRLTMYLHCSFCSLSLMVPRSGTAVADFDLCLSFFFCRFLAWAFSFRPADSMKTCLSKSLSWSSVDGKGNPSFSSKIRQWKGYEG